MSKSQIELLDARSQTELEGAVLALFNAFGFSLKVLEESIQQNEQDGYITHEIIVPGIPVHGCKIRFDYDRALTGQIKLGVRKAEAVEE